MFIKERDKSLNTSRYVTFRAGMKEHVMYRKTGKIQKLVSGKDQEEFGSKK